MICAARAGVQLEGYFWRNGVTPWIDRNVATARSSSCRSSIDATDAAEALVPDRFKALHFLQLPGGHAPPEFAARLADFMQARSR